MIGGLGAVVGGFRVRLGLDTDDYARGILTADGLTRAFGSGLATTLVNPLLGAIGAFGGLTAAIVRHSAQVLSSAEAVERLGQQTGASTDLIQALAGKTQQAGFGAEAGSKGIQVFARRLGEARQGLPDAVRQFETLGVSIDALATTDEAFAAVLEALDRLPDSAQRAAVAARILGEDAGAKLVDAVGGGREALARMIAEQRDLGQVIRAEVVPTLAALNTSVGKTGQVFEGVQDVLLAEFIAGFARELSSIDGSIERISQKVQRTLSPSVNQLGGSLGELVSALGGIEGVLGAVVSYVDEIVGGLTAIVEIARGGGPAIEQYVNALGLASEPSNGVYIDPSGPPTVVLGSFVRALYGDSTSSGRVVNSSVIAPEVLGAGAIPAYAIP